MAELPVLVPVRAVQSTYIYDAVVPVPSVGVAIAEGTVRILAPPVLTGEVAD